MSAVIAIVAGDDGVGEERIARRDAADAQRADRDPGARRQLEVLGEPAVEDDAARRIARVGQLARVAHRQVALVVERDRAHDAARAPQAGRDVGSAHAQLVAFAGGRELERHARRRQADDARAIDRKVHAGDHRARLGRAPRRGHRHLVAARLQRHRLEPAPQRVGQRRRGVEDEVELGEEARAQLGVTLERGQEHVEAARHVEIDRRRDLAQVGDGGGDAVGRRLAAVDVERAAVPQHHVEVVIAAEGVAPRQPVDGDRRLVRVGEKRPQLRDRLLVRAQHALRVDDALGLARRARGEQDLGDRVRPNRGAGDRRAAQRPCIINDGERAGDGGERPLERRAR
jgi:hypothetical protein